MTVESNYVIAIATLNDWLKIIARPITTGTNSAMNQSQFLAIIWNLLKAREKSRVHGAIGL